jgi:hypothetical protein
MEVPPGRKRYVSVNASWPAELPPLEPQEAISAAKRLYRLAIGKAWTGPFQITSGNRYSYIRWGTKRGEGRIFYVNPKRGWHHLVHDISHMAFRQLHPTLKPHDWRHAALERQLITAVVIKGWLSGSLRRTVTKTAPDVQTVRYQRVLARIKAWESKRARAENALKKLAQKRAYYEKIVR